MTTNRAVQLRNALVTELGDRLAVPVAAMVIPDYTPEELADGPRVGVRHISRGLNHDMGPDQNNVVVSVTFFGITAAGAGYDHTRDGYRAEELKLNDQYEETIQQIIGLFTPGGALSRERLVDFRLDAVTQEQAFDVPHYYENGVWVSAVDLTYFDTMDE